MIFFCAGIVTSQERPQEGVDSANLESVIINYVRAREGDWTLSATLTDLAAGSTRTTVAFPNPQSVTGKWSFTVYNEHDSDRPYKKYRETYENGAITAEFFDDIEADIAYGRATYSIQSASGPDAHGWFHLTMTGRLATGGGFNDVHRSIHWNGEILISEFAVRPEGDGGPYRVIRTNTIIRNAN
jgi:hypothetical protein